MSATGFQNRRRMIAQEKAEHAKAAAVGKAAAHTNSEGVVDHKAALSQATVKEALAYAAAHSVTIDPIGKKKAEILAEILAALGAPVVTEGAPALRDATDEETASILEAEGVKVGDVIELADGEKYRIVSMDEKVVIEPVAGEGE